MKFDYMYRVLWIMIFCIMSQTYGQKNYNVSNIPEDLKRNANSIIRSDKTIINIPKQNKIIYTRHKAITVLNKAGDKHVDAFVGYDKSRKIKKLQAVIYDADGKEIEKHKRNDFLDANAVEGGTLYSDNRIKFLPYYPKSYPYTMVIDYVLESDNTAFFPAWYLYTNYNSSIVQKSLVIIYEPSLGLRQKVFDPNGILNIKEGQGQYSVKSTNIEALLMEAYSPDWHRMVPNILFATDKFHLEGLDGTAINWKELGKWEYENLVRGQDKLSKETIAEITDMVVGAESNREKVKLIYRYVQENTRYISVQLGIGGLRPYPAYEVDELGYGDCKGLSNYTKALLKTQGIDSFYAEVWAGNSQRDIEKDFASIQGNHVILYVPLENEEVWLECTSQKLPFNFLGDFTDDRDVVLLTQEGGVIKRTPKYKGVDNKIVTNATFSIDAEGTLSAEIEMESTGVQYDRRFAIAHLDYKQREKFYKRYWDYVDNIILDLVEVSNNKEDVVFKEKIKLRARAYAIKAGDRLFVPINAFQRINSTPIVDNTRKQSINFDREFVYKDEYSIHMPKDYIIESIPKPIEIISPFGNYKISANRVSDSEVFFKRSLQLNEGSYHANKYDEFRNFIRSLKKGDNQKMVIIKTSN
jgi:Domain of Unknown Function with PDB structure (DUF3857)